ncbi:MULTISPECIES: hypothetical protein [Sinorhizobium]|uniref:Uncharacterized protein n=1 Tax=Sinorhizobium americanum TaxID=194963 RepID=A0A2S3YQR2_9HYPH|nr:MULTISPECIES: hypothetical protein [Sinorhizobium]POH33346.1 hypothetical protein ATY30_02725 [Sinorhizobium americanum]POH33520.1 hypothetical protein ATY31_10510 [Sinorhizobium americanum]
MERQFRCRPASNSVVDSNGDDVIIDPRGNDWIDGRSGKDSISAGDGNDRMVITCRNFRQWL